MPLTPSDLLDELTDPHTSRQRRADLVVLLITATFRGTLTPTDRRRIATLDLPGTAALVRATLDHLASLRQWTPNDLPALTTTADSRHARVRDAATRAIRQVRVDAADHATPTGAA